MKFAQSSAVYFNYSLQHAIERLAQIGYTGIEIWGGRPHMYRHDLDEQIPQIRDLLEKHGMTVCNLIPAQFRYPSLLCSDNEDVRRDSIRYIADAMRNAKLIGSPSVSLCPGMLPWDRDLETGRSQLVKSLCELNELNRAYGLTLFIEPAHRFETNLVCTVVECIELMEQVDSDRFGILLDVGHAHVNGEEMSEAIRLASRFPFHLHLDDNDTSSDQHLIPGKGTIDFDIIAATLRDIDYSGYVSVELGHQYAWDPDAACVETLEVLRQRFGGA